MLARIRKALVAGGGAFIGTAASWLASAAVDGSISNADVSAALGAGVAAAAALGYSVFKTRNAGGTATNGSESQ